MVGNARIPDLMVLGRSFVRVRARWARQGRRVRELAAQADEIASARLNGRVRERRRMLDKVREEVGYHSAWTRWSATGDELEQVVMRILDHPAPALPDLIAKFDALLWLLLADGAVVDHVAERELRKFSREIRRLA